jgi:non-specific serine/threonine protein kinase
VGYAELALGNQERGMALLEEGLAIAREAGNKRHVAVYHSSLGVAATLRGEPKRAEALIKESLAIGSEVENKGDLADALESLAGAVGLLGKHRQAARLWGAAAALREATGWHWWAAERRLLEPQLIAARSRMDEADWEAAFEEGKAMNLEEAVRYALSDEEQVAPSSIAVEQPSSAEELPSLTRREEEIAALAAQGMTNRQIAADLSISEHTAATHVRRILKKLGLQSRAQIGSWLTQQRP